ncbi:MAG: lipoyl(octanoyl) transferase, partial [Chloroflexi bacterium RBG_16_57_9]
MIKLQLDITMHSPIIAQDDLTGKRSEIPQRITPINLGHLEYRWALRLQVRLAEARRQEEIGDVLLLVQHPPVITFGRGGGAEDLRITPEALRQAGIGLHQTERGGRATYHGPGQLVAYPILKLPNDDLHTYVWRLEQVILDVLGSFGIAATRVERHPGALVGNDKIAAIGVAVRQGVTMHGLALNVDPPLEHFKLIVPCGIADKGVTSMRQVLGHPVDFEAVESAFVRAFA